MYIYVPIYLIQDQQQHKSRNRDFVNQIYSCTSRVYEWGKANKRMGTGKMFFIIIIMTIIVVIENA